LALATELAFALLQRLITPRTTRTPGRAARDRAPALGPAA
jgi:hypothetical protein